MLLWSFWAQSTHPWTGSWLLPELGQQYGQLLLASFVSRLLQRFSTLALHVPWLPTVPAGQTSPLTPSPSILPGSF